MYIKRREGDLHKRRLRDGLFIIYMYIGIYSMIVKRKEIVCLLKKNFYIYVILREKY